MANAASGSDTEEYEVNSDSDDPDFQPDSDRSTDSDSDSLSSEDSDYVDELDDDVLPHSWNPISDPFSDKRPIPLPEFVGIPGLNPELGNIDELCFTQCIDLYLTTEMVKHIADCTNRKAAQYFQQNPDKNKLTVFMAWNG